MKWWPWIIAGVVLGIVLVGGGVYVTLQLVQQFEGLRLTVYQDEAGKWTIGWGHLVVPGDPYYPYGDVQEITREEADALLKQDLATAEATVRRLVEVPITKNQRAALVSFVFNLGENHFASSTLLRKLNNGDYDGAAAEFDKWVHVGVKVSNDLVARREQEKQLFLTA